MAKLAIQQLLDAGLKHHEAGRFHEAETRYRQILAQQPDHADALHLLGVLADQVGRHDVAVDLIRKSIKINPRLPEPHSNLGNALQSLGQFDEAIKSYQRALVLNPDFADAHNNLGNAFAAKSETDKAIACYQRSLLLRPDSADAHHNLGIALQAKGQIDNAIASYQRAVVLRPDFTDAFASLGQAFAARGEPHKAIAVFQRVVSLQPDVAENYLILANALQEQDRINEAIAAYQRLLELQPDSADAHNILGNALKSKGELDEAVASYRRALSIKPDYPEAHNNLGNVLVSRGQVDNAIASYRRALELRPNFAGAHGNLVYLLHFHPDFDAPAILREQLLWDQYHAQPLKMHIQPHENNRSPDRRIRIGYVSPDFREHVVARNILPLFREHDHQAFEIFCYSSARRSDPYTQRLQCRADHWHTINDMDPVQVAEQIRNDGIDILLDLALYTAPRQLPIFASKPAPVQVTFAGYPGGTGLQAIDYRLTDPYLDPPGVTDTHYTEKSIRLPDSFWCYDADAMDVVDLPPPNSLPALTTGHITFGSLNNFCKVNNSILELWAAAMNAVPQSRLLLLAPQGEARQRTLETLQRQGVTPDRVEFADRRSRSDYLQLYRRIDLGLDCLPYNGHTTTLDSFWMGVPVVTLIGRTIVGRAGWSQLCNLDLRELAAQTPQQFVQIVSTLAADLPRLSQLRSTLRQRMQKSPLMDAPRFARNIESAYRQMWRIWCEQHQDKTSTK